MNDSQEKLMLLFEQGLALDETQKPTHIQTVISNVYVFPEYVYKFYKNDNAFFNTNFHDLSDRIHRHEFTEKDFLWNNSSSPSIYLRLIPISASADRVVACDRAEADELLIVMRRVDTQSMLFERLMEGSISETDSYEIGKGLAKSLERVRKNSTSTQSYFEIFNNRVTDVRSWIGSVDSIPIEEGKNYCDFLESFRTSHQEYFEQVLSKELAWGGDIHSHNVLYADKEFFLMDTYSPKEEWLLEHWTIPLYRIATDLWALSGKREYFEACVRGYEEGMGKAIDRKLDPAFILYAATIAAPYHYMLQQSDKSKEEAARRFHAFIRTYYASIQ